MKIGSPCFRQEIIYHLRDLSDIELQKNHWVSKDRDDGFWWDLKESLSFLMDDMWLLDTDVITEEVMVSRFFYDMEEYHSVYKLLKLIDGQIKRKQPDLYYLNHPLWPKVVKMAKEAYDLLMANNEKYNFAKNLEEFENMTNEERFKYLGHED